LFKLSIFSFSFLNVLSTESPGLDANIESLACNVITFPVFGSIIMFPEFLISCLGSIFKELFWLFKPAI